MKFDRTLRYLEVSTEHVDHRDIELLEEQATLRSDAQGMDMLKGLVLTAVTSYPEGFFIYVPVDGFETRRTALALLGFSQNFIALLSRCYEESITLIVLDQDCKEHADLPKGDWVW